MGEYIIAKYIRLSADDSKSDSMSISSQRLMLDKYIADMDIPNITAMEFVDNGHSGTNFERPAVQELLDLVRMGKIDCIMVKDFSRFGRNALETGYFLERVFPLYRTRFISVCDYYDSDKHEGSTGGIEVALKFIMHEEYSRDLSKKIKAAKYERMKRGEFITKNCAFGYKKVANKLEIDEPAADTVRLIFKLASEGKSLSMIAGVLYEQNRQIPAVYKNQARKIVSKPGFDCVWEKSVLLKILHDEQYIGTYIAGKSVMSEVGSRIKKEKPESEWIKIPNNHPAIISREVYDKAQAVIDIKGEPLRNRKIGTSARYAEIRNSPLKGRVVCGTCGHTMQLSMTKNAAFHCSFTRSAPNAKCYKLRVLRSELENMIFEIISKQVEISLSADNLNEVDVVTLEKERQSEHKRRMEQINDAKRDLYECFTLGEIKANEYISRKTEIDAESSRLNHSYVISAKQLSQKKFEAMANTKLKEAALCENGLSRELVDLLIEKIYVYPDCRIEVKWKIADLSNYNTELRA